ncbi:trypsin-like peptidase domain-containing protein [Streptomyces olivoreticuli]|uniref:trypsin-like peptidase domain-containing protein n=1 Tax=Streptomyces olivoreticuli TaxID=68246 RepID=UPI00265A04D3|nr:trypsin-like peptidase domain-containing protein [Streptomyces olivoreticuli]WKK23861.1 trypsin-like peptidase domain-containing protein [Streptomyces olivoreticuli]
MRDAFLPRVLARIRGPLAVGACGVVAAGMIYGGQAQAVQPPRDGVRAGAQADPEDAPLIDSGSAAGRKFRSSGRLVGGGGTTCTATLVHAPGKPDPGAKAIVLSNGHCVSDTMKTNEVVVDQPAGPDWSFTPAYFHDNAAEHKAFPVERVAYATMKGIDVSVLQLSATYGELARLDVTPRTLATARPAPGTPLQAAHAPTDGVDPDRRYLRLSACKVTASSVALHEYTWLWRDFTRTDCLGISGGSSGGPVTTASGEQIVGMLNTVSTPGYLGCGLGRPCEGSASGLVVPKDNTVYATPVDAVASCLDGTGLRLDRSGCRLDRGEQVDVASSGQHTQSNTPQGPARWDARVTPRKDAHHAYAAFKTGPFGAVDCTDPRGYTRPRPLPATGLAYTELLPKHDNLYVLCAVGGPDARLGGGEWAKSLAHPSYAYARVDNTPPTVAPQVDIQQFGTGADSSYWVRPVYMPWEITSYKVKYGPKGGTDCSDPEGYRPYLGVPASLKGSEGPWTYCAIGYDNADNPTPPSAFTIG